MAQGCIYFAIFLYFLSGVSSQVSDSKTTTTTVTNYVTDLYEGYSKNHSYCFRFTWLGPTYDETSDVNGTCNDLSESLKLKNTPCKQPLVITHNGAPPNMTDLWYFYRDNVLCKRATGESCVKYSYYFNGNLQNVTYMCGRVLTIEEGAENSGCYTQSESGYETEVCVCTPKTKSDNGYMPCNSANALKMSIVILVFTLNILFVSA